MYNLASQPLSICAIKETSTKTSIHLSVSILQMHIYGGHTTVACLPASILKHTYIEYVQFTKKVQLSLWFIMPYSIINLLRVEMQQQKGTYFTTTN